MFVCVNTERGKSHFARLWRAPVFVVIQETLAGLGLARDRFTAERRTREPTNPPKESGEKRDTVVVRGVEPRFARESPRDLVDQQNADVGDRTDESQAEDAG